jgi:Holliday junction resolvase RusA-like endonuclease
VAADRTSWAVKVYGTPAPKGSMKCIGGRGRHQLVNSNPNTKPWQQRIAEAAAELVAQSPEDFPLEGPLRLMVTTTVARPKSVTREWPYTVGTGDTDKHYRALLDGLEQGGVLTNDVQVVQLGGGKAYPDSPGDYQLEHPGAYIRIYRL